MIATLLYRSNCLLGEGAFWHSSRHSFLWVDIDGQKLYEYELISKKVNSWSFNHRASMIALDKQGRCMIVFQGGVARIDFDTGNLDWLAELEREVPDNRSNDGAVDSAGRLWIGTMNMQFEHNAGSLYCVDTNLKITKKLDELSIPNGLAWSLDNRTMYHVDSPTRTVRAYSFDSDSGIITFDRIAITIPAELGSPDGMCIDEDGMLWIAQWNGFGVYRWNPLNGTLLDKIVVPVPQVSSCAFGGTHFDQLFITTARENFTKEDLLKYPDSGSVYIVNPNVRGVPKNLFGN
jgi:sugar lactone lactonase YvrE